VREIILQKCFICFKGKPRATKITDSIRKGVYDCSKLLLEYDVSTSKVKWQQTTLSITDKNSVE